MYDENDDDDVDGDVGSERVLRFCWSLVSSGNSSKEGLWQVFHLPMMLTRYLSCRK